MRYKVICLSLVLVTCFCVSIKKCSAQLSSKLPILEIEASVDEIPDEFKILTQFRVVSDPNSDVNQTGGPTSEYVGTIGIERRGSTSQQLFPKYGYAIELRTANGIDTSAAILGMPEEEDWVLHGPYSDKTLIRNAFAYTLAGDLMDYAPRSRFVELVIGGEYWGVYLLTEKVKRDRNRVDVAKLEPTDITGDDLTGGYILKFDKLTAESNQVSPGFILPEPQGLSGNPSQIVYHYPKSDRITLEQSAYIQDHLIRFEAALASTLFDDYQLGYAPYVDIGSFVDFMLVNEVTRNVDGYRLSSYFSKTKNSDGGKLKMGPVWDFNIALANADYCAGSSVEGWQWEFNSICPDDGFQIPLWIGRMMQSEIFLDSLTDRYFDLRQNKFLRTSAIHQRIDSLTQLIGSDAIARNFSKWDVLNSYTWPNSFVPSSHQEAISHLKDWLRERLNWMDGAMSSLASLPTVQDPFIHDPVIAPNPGDENAKLKNIVFEKYPVSLEIFNSQGKKISEQKVEAEDADLLLPTQRGIYFYKLDLANGGSYSGKWFNHSF